MIDKLISVIIPVYNGEEFIEETLKSISGQKGVNFEIIIIDDGSTDRTKDIICSLNLPNIEYHWQTNSGVSKARNNGLYQSNGDFVIFFDADDIMSQDYLYARVEKMNITNADICGGQVVFFESGENTLQKASIKTQMVRSILSYDNALATCPSSYLIKKEFLISNHITFNEKLTSSADKYFLLKVFKFGKWTYVENAPLYYRTHNNSMSKGVKIENIHDGIRFYNFVNENISVSTTLKKVFIAKKSLIIALELITLSWRYIPKSMPFLANYIYSKIWIIFNRRLLQCF